MDTLLPACRLVASQIQPLENSLPGFPKDVDAVQIYIQPASFFNSSSPMIFTPSDFAFSYLEPGSSPRTR